MMLSPLPPELEVGYGTYRWVKASDTVSCDPRVADRVSARDRQLGVLARWRAWRISKLSNGDPIAWRCSPGGELYRGLVVRVGSSVAYVMVRIWQGDGYSKKAIEISARQVELVRGRAMTRRARFDRRETGQLFGGVA